MEEEKYRILSDLKKIEAIVMKINLRDERVRKKLARLLCNENIFEHKIGALFVQSLENRNNYETAGYQRKVLDDCRKFADILNYCDSGEIDEIAGWQHMISAEDNLLFRSWMQKPAIYYINRYFESKKRGLCAEANQNQNYDLKVIYSLSSKYVFDREDDANRLYGLLLKKKGEIFRSWIGVDFVEKIQKRTTEYKKLAKRRRRLCKAAAVCAASAILIVFPVTYTSLHDYTNHVKAQVLDAMKGLGAGETEKEVSGERAEGNAEAEILVQYRDLHAANEDLVGWLEIEGPGISFPVMQRVEDEDFYLDHDFYLEPEKRGALFVDGKTGIFPKSENIVIYGHNMSDGTMFGKLKKYEDKNFYLENPGFTFDTIYETGEYEIAAVVKTHVLKKEDDGFRYYQVYDYENQEQFGEFVQFIRQNQLYDTGVDLLYGDTFVILSTCEYSTEQGRLLVIGKRAAMIT